VKPVERPEEVRPGTLLETDEDIRQALLAKQPGTAAPKRSGTLPETDEDIRQALLAKPAGAAAPKPSSPAAGANLFRPTLRAPVALLTVLDDGKNDGEVLRLRTDRFVIGRAEGDFLIPHDSLISARHLEINRHRTGEQYRWVITDLKSTNGLFVRCSRIALVDQAEFLVGKGRYRFEPPGGGLPNTLDDPGAEVQRGSTNALGTDVAALLHPALIELLGEKMLSRLPLAKPEYWIGSHPACSICRVGDPFVEPQHVRLRREANGAWHAQNNKSPNGLWLRVPQVTVADSCAFQIGEQRFRLKVGG
jgi:pSer/pThr/pTyr-binding forkhead associated (FHA) protein